MALLTETRRYSIAELLSLRTTLPVVSCLVKNINQHPDIACIFKIPDEALRRPEQFSCTSAHLADITNKPVVRQLSRKNLTESSEQSEPRSFDLGRLHGPPQQLQWQLRRRDNSDRSSQPHSAPTGLAAQQSENFQKFYRAVVSPTHVRVTAGGRIVPNTRSPAAAPSESNGDKTELEQKSLEPASWVPDASSVYPQIPQFPGPFLPPYNFPPQPSAFGFPIMPAPPTGYYGAGLAEQQSKSPFGSQQPAVKAQQIKISPPIQFDQTKPFTYNGQVVYPVPYGVQPPPNSIPVPMGMLGNPNFFSQIGPQPAGLMPSTLPFHQFANSPNPMAFTGAQQSSMLAMPNGAQGSETFMPSMSMPGIFSPSDHMKSQLQLLQTQLHQIDTILASDKHRYDRALLEQQRTGLLSQIEHIEERLQVHHRREGTATETVRRGYKSGGPHEEQKSTRTASENLQADGTTKGATIGDSSVASRSDMPSKSKLTIAAAMAPPFQPRSRTTVTSAAQSLQPKHAKHMSRSTSAIESNGHEETPDEVAARLMANSTTDWLRTGLKFGSDRGYDVPKEQSRINSSRQSAHHEKTRVYQRSSTSSDQVPQIKSNLVVPPPETVPYLIGTLPTGVSAQGANANDLVYSRPLTDDELRARYLYWGKAPRSVQSGLPKFDGKDFYPPSPVKKAASTASVKSVESQVPLETESEKLYPFRLPSNDIAYLKPIPQPIFTDAKSRGTSQQSSSASSARLHNRWSRDSAFGRNRESAVEEKVVQSAPNLDFSQLFMEKGCPGYRSPSPKPTVVRVNRDQEELPITPQNATFFEEAEDEVDDAKSDDSWQPADRDAQRYKSENSVISVDSTTSGTEQTESTVEITLSPRANGDRIPPKHPKSFDERVENFKNVDEQTIFLQKMLKNEGRAGTALSGTVSSATAQGFLPQYRGSAVASLAPADYIPYKSASLKSTNSQSENRPANQDKYERESVHAPQTATEYLRQIREKIYETDQPTIDQGWNPNTTARGPVRPGEEW